MTHLQIYIYRYACSSKGERQVTSITTPCEPVSDKYLIKPTHLNPSKALIDRKQHFCMCKTTILHYCLNPFNILYRKHPFPQVNNFRLGKNGHVRPINIPSILLHRYIQPYEIFVYRTKQGIS